MSHHHSSLPYFLLAFIVLAIFANVATAACTEGTGVGECQGKCIVYPTDSFCSCPSGSTDALCATQVSGCDADFLHVVDDSTDLPSPVVSLDFVGDNFVATVLTPLVTERTHTKIAIDSTENDDENCVYPGVNWVHDVDTCQDRYVGTLAWPASKACGWVLDNADPDDYLYRATMTIDHYDLTAPFASRAGASPVERNTHYEIPLLLRFQKFIELTTNIIVQAPIAILTAIPLQQTDAQTKTAIIEVETNVLHPYTLITPTVNTRPSALAGVTITEITASPCANDPAQTCTQRWRVSIDAGTECTITGEYKLGFDLNCQEVSPGVLPASCAITPGDDAEITLDVVSEDFCGEVSVDVDITGTLKSYLELGLTTEKTQFFVGQTMYFQASLSSSAATLVTSVLNSVRMEDPVTHATVHSLYASGAGLIPEANFDVDSETDDVVTFHYTLDNYITALPADSSRAYDVVARIDVTYQGVSGTKRLVLEANLGKSVRLGTSVTVENDPLAGAAPAISSVSFFTVLLSFLATFLFAF